MGLVSYYRSMSLPKKASLWYLICNILQKGISFFVVPFYVHYLTTSEYGHVSMFFSWREILMIFATLSLYSGVYTKAMVDYEDDRDRYTSSMLGLTTILTIILFLLYIIAVDRWNALLEIDDVTGFLLFASFLAFPPVSFWSVRQRVENKYKNMVALTMSKAICAPTLVILLMLKTDLRANAMIWGLLIVEIAFGVFLYVWQFVKGRCFYDKKYWVHALKFNIPLIPHYLSLIVLSQVDRLLVGSICGKDKAGIYSLAAQIALLMNVVTSAINGALIPWLYQQFKVLNVSKVKQSSNYMCILVGVLSILMMLVAPEIVRVIGTDEYLTSIWIIPPLVLGVYYTFVYGLYVSVTFYYNETKYVMIATTIGACLSVLLNLLMLPRFGFIAAGYSSMLCYFSFMVMHYYFMLKVSRKKLSGIRFFDVRFIWQTCVLLFCVMLLIILLYNISFLYRYVIIVLVFFVLLKYREFWKHIIVVN